MNNEFPIRQEDVSKEKELVDAILAKAEKDFVISKEKVQEQIFKELFDLYNQYVGRAVEIFRSENGSGVPVLINKHFAAVFIDFCGRKFDEQYMLTVALKFFRSNPEMPKKDTPFMVKYGPVIDEMDQVLGHKYEELKDGDFALYLKDTLRREVDLNRRRPYTSVLHIFDIEGIEDAEDISREKLEEHAKLAIDKMLSS